MAEIAVIEATAGTSTVTLTRYDDGETEIQFASFDYAFVKTEDLVKALREIGLLPEADEQDGFYGAVAKWLREYGFGDVREVLDVQQDERSGGYCETCWYEEIVVEITYTDSEGERQTHTFYGDMGEFMRELTD